MLNLNEADPTEAHLRYLPLEACALDGAGGGTAEIVIDYLDLGSDVAGPIVIAG